MSRENEIRGGMGRLNKMSYVADAVAHASGEMSRIGKEMEDVSKELDELRKKRNDVVAKTSYGIGKRMGQVLPFGSALFRIDDSGGLDISFVRDDGTSVPYRGLSGGERVMFDAALSNAVGGKGLLVIEASELDRVNLGLLMKKLESDTVGQTFVMTWSKPSGKLSDKWNVMECGKEKSDER